MFRRFLFKLLYGITWMLPRKYRISGSSIAALCFLLILCVYMYTTHYSINSDKAVSLDSLNDTGFADSPVIVNTENINVMLRKQQVHNAYEKPILVNETVGALQSISISEYSPNCGLKKPCDKNEFAIHIYSGVDNRDEPKLCIDGKYVISKRAQSGGRGLNIAVVDNVTRTIMKVVNFDTYVKDSTVLETLLLTLRPGDIVVMFTFDEPSRKLSRVARLLLYEMGSALIQNLGYRNSWYLVTQKGLSGFSPFEDLHFIENNGWPYKHDVRFCVPFEIKGQLIHPDPLPSTNPSRVEFCEKYDDLPLFCDADVVNDPLTPSIVWKQTAAINRIYDVPIIVMSGDDVQLLPLTLETLVRQPGVKPALVAVYHLPQHTMVPSLSDLFGFMSEELSQTSNYCDRVAEAFEMNNLIFHDNKELIFIGENVILSPDFMYYLGQLLSVLQSDKTIQSISAVNENGFRSLSGDPTLAYRVESITSLAMLTRRDFFQKAWCRKGSLDPMFLPPKGFSVIPEVSRATLASPISTENPGPSASEAFIAYDRTVTYEQNIVLKHPERLTETEYDKDLKNVLSTAVPLLFDTRTRKLCQERDGNFQAKLLDTLSHYTLNGTSLSNKPVMIYFHQANETDLSTLQLISRCVGLFYHDRYPVRGLYKGILRFMLNENPAFLVGTKSSFFTVPSKKVAILKLDSKSGTLVNIPPP